MRTAYILGGASCIWDDLHAALGDEQIPDGMGLGLRQLQEGDGFIAVNDIGCEFPYPLDVWCSLHGWELLRKWMPQRAARKLSPASFTYSGLDAGDMAVCKEELSACVEAKFPGQTDGGSSGLFAVKVALMDRGYDRAILCGMPMTEMPHFFKSPDDHPIPGRLAGWQAATSYWCGWLQAMPHLQGKVFSMSGWTKETFGAPPK